MKILILILGIWLSFKIQAKTLCDEKAQEIYNEYNSNGHKLEQYEVMNCSTKLTGRMPEISSRMKDFVNLSESSACLIILRKDSNSLDELAVFDLNTKFILKRSFQNPKEAFSLSRIGDKETGLIIFIKREGEKLADDMDYITRAEYDQAEKKLTLRRWEVGLFFNRYSHDYSVDCL